MPNSGVLQRLPCDELIAAIWGRSVTDFHAHRLPGIKRIYISIAVVMQAWFPFQYPVKLSTSSRIFWRLLRILRYFPCNSRLMAHDIGHGPVLNVIELVERLEMRASVHLDIAAEHVRYPSTPLVSRELACWDSEDLIELFQGHPGVSVNVS